MFWGKSLAISRGCQDSSCLLDPNIAVVVGSHVVRRGFVVAL